MLAPNTPPKKSQGYHGIYPTMGSPLTWSTSTHEYIQCVIPNAKRHSDVPVVVKAGYTIQHISEKPEYNHAVFTFQRAYPNK
jgi:hypothetical protein